VQVAIKTFPEVKITRIAKLLLEQFLFFTAGLIYKKKLSEKKA